MKNLVNPPTGWQPDWLTSAFSQKIVSALGEDNVRFVGGAVRDSLLGLAVTDVDMATKHPPDQVCTMLEKAGIKVIPTGLAHGTVTAVWQKKTCEITTLRRDIETDGRHAKIVFTDDWWEDASRRDFTINALYATPDGRIFDPFDGMADLEAGIIRFIGDPELRIKEDALRILRFFRFSARFGFSLDEAGLLACRVHADDIKSLSHERVRDEILKLLTVPDPRSFVGTMHDLNILPSLDPGEPDVSGFDELVAVELEAGQFVLPIIRLETLYSSSSCRHIARYFRLSGQQEKYMQSVRDARQAVEAAAQLEPVLYQYGTAVVAEVLKTFDSPRREEFFRALTHWRSPSFPVAGHDLIALGIEPGEVMGAKLKAMEQRWIDSGFTMSKQELLLDQQSA